MTTRSRTESTTSYDPAAEVVEICRDLIRIDTTNYGDGSGPGERKAAEHVAALLDEVGIEPELYEAVAGPHQRGRPLGRPDDGRPAAAARPPRRRPRRGRRLDRSPVLRGDPGRLPVGPRRGRHEGLRRDAALASSGRGPAPASSRRAADGARASPPTRRPAATRAPSRSSRNRPDLLEGCTEGIGEVGGFSATVRGRRVYLIEAAEKGMAWMRLTAKGTAGHGSMRNPDNAVTALTAAVARIGAHEWPVRLTPSMQVLLASIGELAGVEATPENAEALVEEFGSAARMLGAVIKHTTNPTMLSAGYKVNVVPGEATAHVDGRFLPGYEDEFFDTLAELVGTGSTSTTSATRTPWRRPSTATSSTR